MRFCEDAEMSSRLNLQKSMYEGPTGIIGVLNQNIQEAGIPAISYHAGLESEARKQALNYFLEQPFDNREIYRL